MDVRRRSEGLRVALQPTEHLIHAAQLPRLVIPAKAGIHFPTVHSDAAMGRKDGNTGGFHKNGWIPAFAGMTGVGVCDAKPRTA